ncbi:N-acetyltransferase [Clostridium frigidicarnis]|uniref:Putative acetyltransferase n=1 Tax=Clostridium frigidicarnis TaxID=84698 RepID=A0A1I1ARM9_9CLOT|nr:N-acetyltransferase [Clostridium frigidicarnis]SFB39000.1 putative acetyltransferase [Clostridium frigidicarnis]
MIKNIKKLEKDNVDRVMEIWLDSTVKAHDFIDKSYWLTNYDTVKNNYIPMSETYVYEESNIIKGFISIIEGEFIGALFVDSKSQNKGIGKKLIDYVKNNYNNLSLAVYKENKNAVNFYINQGFSVNKEQISDDSSHIEFIMNFK